MKMTTHLYLLPRYFMVWCLIKPKDNFTWHTIRSLCFELCSTITLFMYILSAQRQEWQSSHLGIFTALKLVTNLIKILQGYKFLSFLTCCFPCTVKSNVITNFCAPQTHIHNFCVFRENKHMAVYLHLPCAWYNWTTNMDGDTCHTQ